MYLFHKNLCSIDLMNSTNEISCRYFEGISPALEWASNIPANETSLPSEKYPVSFASLREVSFEGSKHSAVLNEHRGNGTKINPTATYVPALLPSGIKMFSKSDFSRGRSHFQLNLFCFLKN